MTLETDEIRLISSYVEPQEGKNMFDKTKSFSSLSVDDLEAAKRFYGKTLEMYSR